MRRLLIFSVMLAMLFGGMVWATETRVETMGEANAVVKDVANIWLYPQAINCYPNLFTAEIADRGVFLDKMGADDLFQAGAHFKIGDKKPMVIGAYFTKEPYYHDIMWDAQKMVGPSAEQRLHFFYGRELADIPFGFMFGYYNNGAKVDNADTDTVNVKSNYKSSLSRVEFTFGLSPMQGKLDLSAQLAFTTWTDEDWEQAWNVDSARYDQFGVVDDTKPDGNIDFAVNARYWWQLENDWTLIPHGQFFYSKQGLEDYGYDGENDIWALWASYSRKTTTFEFGMGGNYQAAKNVLAITDLGFRFKGTTVEAEYEDRNIDDTEQKWHWNLLPYFKIGLDARVFKWMDFRAGVISEWTRYKNEFGKDLESSSCYVETTTFLGAGFHWGDLTIDARVNPDFLQNGPYFISGDSTDDFSSLFSRVSLLYQF